MKGAIICVFKKSYAENGSPFKAGAVCFVKSNKNLPKRSEGCL